MTGKWQLPPSSSPSGRVPVCCSWYSPEAARPLLWAPQREYGQSNRCSVINAQVSGLKAISLRNIS